MAKCVLVIGAGDATGGAIRTAVADGSLSFFCAIDEGLVFTVARPQDMLRSTASMCVRRQSSTSIRCRTAAASDRWPARFGASA